MRGFLSVAALAVSLLPGTSLADTNGTTLSSRHILPSTFVPPAVFENVNLVRTINLERAYVRETINVAVRNIGSQPQNYYYLPFEGDIIGGIGGVEARDKRREDSPAFDVKQVEHDPYRCGNDCFPCSRTNKRSALPNSTASLFLKPLHPRPSRPSQSPSRSFPPTALYQPR